MGGRTQHWGAEGHPKSRGKWGKTDQRGKTDFLAQTSGAIPMLEYIIATFVLVCPSHAGNMVGLAGTVAELFAKMLFSTKPSYVKGR